MARVTVATCSVVMTSVTDLAIRQPVVGGSAEDVSGSRLSKSLVEAVHLLEQLGKLVDTARLGRAGVEHVLELTTKPVIATHSSAVALYAHQRNLTDEQLCGIPVTGGIVCVNFLTSQSPRVDHLAEHVASNCSYGMQ